MPLILPPSGPLWPMPRTTPRPIRPPMSARCCPSL
nr:MAG TPA_asm: hypothetical protein [Caudoviricetes sp.]